MFPIEKTDEMLSLLVTEAARKEGGARLQECLRNLWEVAVRIGHQHGEKEIRLAREEAYEVGKKDGLGEVGQVFDARHKKELEEERVWGFDVGWRLATEKNTLKASKIPASPPSLPVVSTAATQMDVLPDVLRFDLFSPPPTPTLPSLSALIAQRFAPDPLPPPLLPLPLPSSSPYPPASTLPPRDFSALRTGTVRPFGSLQRRARRSTHPPCSRHTQQTTARNIYKTGPAHSTLPSQHRPLPRSRQPLDWNRDPRLQDLNRALTALGWVRR
ncbi:hypothetical protein C8J57DRAFT_1536883 [Mycena rebaudengoi]|nr:hypothetical protein C8J57DRAFT_1536883 [Mycena rebaudengoi]